MAALSPDIYDSNFYAAIWAGKPVMWCGRLRLEGGGAMWAVQRLTKFPLNADVKYFTLSWSFVSLFCKKSGFLLGSEVVGEVNCCQLSSKFGFASWGLRAEGEGGGGG